MLSLPRSCWVGEAENLQNETLVFLIRQTHRVNDEVCGGLIEELRKRIVERTRRFGQSLDDVDEEELILNVEIKILELVLTKEPSRNRDFLEIGFAKTIQDLARNHLKQHEKSPMGQPMDFVDCRDEVGENIERPIEFVPDDAPGPEETLLNLDDRIRRHRLLRKALSAVTDRRHREAVILHCAYGLPISSTRRGQKSLKRHFRKDPRQIKYWIATALEQMRAVLGVQRLTARRSVSPRPSSSTREPNLDLMPRDTSVASLRVTKHPYGRDVVTRETSDASISTY